MWYTVSTRAVVTGPTTFSQGKNKIPFYKKQVIYKGARVILGLLGLLYYSAVNRKAVSKVRKLSAAHALVMLTK